MPRGRSDRVETALDISTCPSSRAPFWSRMMYKAPLFQVVRERRVKGEGWRVRSLERKQTHVKSLLFAFYDSMRTRRACWGCRKGQRGAQPSTIRGLNGALNPYCGDLLLYKRKQNTVCLCLLIARHKIFIFNNKNPCRYVYIHTCTTWILTTRERVYSYCTPVVSG